VNKKNFDNIKMHSMNVGEKSKKKKKKKTELYVIMEVLFPLLIYGTQTQQL
jgi:hypothetical protein